MENKREQIKKIKANTSLTESEKNVQIQQLMMGKYSDILINKLKSNESKICSHYTKNCYKFYFDCCNICDPCKRCHGDRGCCNNFNSIPNPISSITCSLCELTQKPSNKCIGENCQEEFSSSYCGICQIWTSKQIFHCNKCGICRIGTKDTLFHCDSCGICFNKSDSENISVHKCAGFAKNNWSSNPNDLANPNELTNPNDLANPNLITNTKSQNNYKEAVCVVCSENTFNSQSESFPLDCGHFIHKDCFDQYIKQGCYKCPLCKKSIGDMKAQWDFLRYQIKAHPIPNDFFPINPDDLVDSPYGKFLIKSIGFDEVTLSKMYTGILVDWIVSSKDREKKAQATLNSISVKKNYYKDIHCNDCGSKSNVKFHPYGLECNNCKGFNTQE